MAVKPLIKALTDAGAGPRRRMADDIKNGRVSVNGVIAESFKQPVDTASDAVSVSGRRVDLSPVSIICLALNKPEGVVSTLSDEKGRPTVIDILPTRYRNLRIYPVGRLDIDTTGLILLTNDGNLTYRLTHPKFEYEKEYLVRIKGRLKSEDFARLEKGVRLEDGMTHPARLKTDSSTPPFRYSITIHEGRKRQVRRMFERLGYPVLALKRVRVGDLKLGDLKEGEVRRLSDKEIGSLLHE
jgi:23S rRNA pseudouridine2605 synthase